MIDDDDLFQIDRSRIQFERFEDETVLINVENGFYYSVSPSGSEVLDLVERGCPAHGLSAALFGVQQGPMECRTGIVPFLEELVREGILIRRRADHPAYATPYPRDPVYPSIDSFEPPVLERFDEVRDLLLIDPVHMVDPQEGWPRKR